MSSFLSRIHEQMAAAVKFMERAANAGDGPVAAHWMNIYISCWDDLESQGLSINIPLPQVPVDTYRYEAGVASRNRGLERFWPADFSFFSGKGFEEPKRCA